MTQPLNDAEAVLPPDDEVSLIDLLTAVGEEKFTIAGIAALCTAVGLAVALLSTPIYTAKTTLLPPQQSQSSASAVAASLGALAATAGVAGAIKAPEELYVGLLKTDAVANALIERFKLKERYDQSTLVEVRRELAQNVRVSADRKSTLISAISNARPKIADYPFTTLHPNLGVVRVGPEQSFVVADVPGLIEGASEGAGLGHQFLRHLQRTRLLLHIIDFAPFDDSVDPVAQAKAIVAELKKYDKALYNKPRWLVLNKLDMVPADEREARVKDFIKRFRYKGPVFEISALTREGCEPLIKAIYQHIKAQQVAEQAPVEMDPRFANPASNET